MLDINDQLQLNIKKHKNIELLNKEQSLSNKADAVISALGAADPEFGHTQYALPLCLLQPQ